ncbi:1-phosphofructokinase family hexose kinase [Thiospirochaeta perfilievii]|uniref:1-phosphofructokinase family hexose kinase n=1 Tax=Thiospirochaeta perfilievii TaxID=252967 RepID=A0A5C1Q6N8_9SPIO|nr:1-phosphofructokinase family hexose kinase [Thiospirochaeta perfilievii]QEN03655.1 1-phosphofructokinase family hexose kinase [Thiospirochaeta perfilievii]
MKKRVLTVTLNPAVDFTIEVPNFKIDSINKATHSRRDPGGKGINVSTALSDGGFITSATGFIGKENRDIFTSHFRKKSIIDNFIYVDGLTREGIKVTDTENEITTDINFNGIDLKQKDIDNFIIKYKKIIKGFDFVILSGSLPRSLPYDFYTLLAKIARENRVFVALDSSKEALLSSINSGFINLIKPNINELTEIYPEIQKATNREKTVDLLAKKLLQKVEIVALSLGEDGSKLYTRDRIYIANAPKVKVKTTVGAGDTFLAGFIFGLINTCTIKDALKTGVSWATSKITKYGPGLSKTNPPQLFCEKILIEEK